MQIDSGSSVASDLYFRSHVATLTDSTQSDPPTVSSELSHADTVDITLIVLWKVQIDR